MKLPLKLSFFETLNPLSRDLRVFRFIKKKAARRQVDFARLRAGIAGDLPQLEDAFIHISEEVGTLDTHCQAMLSQCEQLKDLATGEGRGDSLVMEIRGLLSAPLSYIDECLSKQEELLTLVMQCRQKTESMLRVRAKMADALAPLNFMTVLFKIESAYLHEDQRDTFITVTVEIDKLRALVEETFKKNTELLTHTHDTLQDVHRRLDDDFTKQATMVGEKRKNIDRAFENLDTQVASNATRDQQMHATSSQLAQQVSTVVIGLQFQDIFKQRCDQVLGGIKDLEALQAKGAALGDSSRCRLDLAVVELDGGISSVRSGVNLIRELMEQLEAHSLMHADDSGGGEGSDGLVQLLLDAIQDVHDVIHAMAELTEQAHAAVKPAGDIAMSMTTALTELALNMQHIALNAQVRSVWIGAGTGLEELAARTAVISNEISQISEQTSLDLASLQATICEMLTTFEDFRRRGHEQLDHLATMRSHTEARLHSLRDHTISTIHTIGTGVDAIKGSVSMLNQQLEKMDGVRDRVHEHSESLAQGLMQCGIPFAVLKPDEKPAAKAPGVAAGQAGGDGLDLFDEVVVPAVDKPAGQAGKVAANQDVELF